MKHSSFSLPLLLAAGALVASTSFGGLVLSDDFENGNPTTGAAVHPNQWSLNGGTATESGGLLTLSTSANSTRYSQGSFSTGVSPAFNIFTQTVTISVREFSISGIGDFAADGKNFRLGLIPTNTAGAQVTGFYNSGNDGVALRLVNARTFLVAYKADSVNDADPGTTAGMVATTGANSGTLAFDPTGFDLNFSATQWGVTFFGAGGETSVNAGTWNLTSYEGTWGNAGDGFGNSALLTYVQNGSYGTDASNNESLHKGSVLASFGNVDVVTAVPEPTAGLLGALGAMSLALVRRRR